MIKKTPNTLFRNLVYRFCEIRYETAENENTNFDFCGTNYKFERIGLRDSAFYVVRKHFIQLYEMDVPHSKKDADGYIKFQTQISNWCKNKSVELGLNENYWVNIREFIQIRARKVIEVKGETDIICKPEHTDMILKDTLFILFCEKEDSGKKIQDGLLSKGYKCKMVLSEGIAKGVEQFLLIKIFEEILKKGESYQVVSIHDDDVGGAKIFKILNKYIPNLIDGGLNKEFWEYFNDSYNYSDYAETYEPEENAISYIISEGYKNLTEINRRVELPVFILSEGAEAIVDFIEHKTKGLQYNLDRIGIRKCRSPYTRPERIDNLNSNIDELQRSIYPKTKEIIDLEDKIYEVKEEKDYDLEELEKQYEKDKEEIEGSYDETIESYEEELENLEYELKEKRDLVYNVFYENNQDDFETDWTEESLKVMKVFHKFHNFYTDNLLDISEKIRSQSNFLNRLVNKGLKNKRVLNELENGFEEYNNEIRFFKALFRSCLMF